MLAGLTSVFRDVRGGLQCHWNCRFGKNMESVSFDETAFLLVWNICFNKKMQVKLSNLSLRQSF